MLRNVYLLMKMLLTTRLYKLHRSYNNFGYVLVTNKRSQALHTYAYGYAYVLVAATHSCQHWKCRIYYGVFKCYAMKLKLSRANGRKSILTCCTNFGYSHKMCRSRSMFVCIVYIRACVNRCACLFSVKRNLWKFA